MSTPSFFTHLGLLWRLRATIALNRSGTTGRVAVIIGFIASSAPAVGLGAAAFQVVRLSSQLSLELWPDFLLRLLCFVTSCVFVIWPVLSAGVDDHSELSRYAAFPISSLRLMVASALGSLAEPRALVFYGPLIGASLGYISLRPPAHPLVLLWSFVAYVAMNLALARVALHLMLNVLRQQQSAQLLGGGFVLTLVVASFIPPVDTSWLTTLQTAGVQAVPDSIIADAAKALGRFPTGYFAHALTMSAQGRFVDGARDAIFMTILAAVAGVVAWGVLIDFHRQSGRAPPIAQAERTRNPFARSATVFTTLMVRELVDLFHNPRARLLVAVPFVLGILLKLLSARDLFVFFLGPSADAWLMSGLSLYGAVVLGSTFSQNAFAYDGTGFATFVAAPIELRDVLRAKNAVHAGAGIGLAGAVVLFVLVYFRAGGAPEALLSLASVLTLMPVMLVVGNELSVRFPVKFHANLKRRDRLPFVASMIGVAAAAGGTWPMVIALRIGGRERPSSVTIALVFACALAAWLVYWLTFPFAARRVVGARERILLAVTRE